MYKDDSMVSAVVKSYFNPILSCNWVFDELQDPTAEEEKVLEAKISVSVREDGKICAMQKMGRDTLSEEEVSQIIDLAVKKSKELRKLL